ncbi:MAG: hypothetical protein RDV41_02300 [Planctomycetota bacterium]|nr:hypothetical protein [Planctomycetota bacterium]
MIRENSTAPGLACPACSCTRLKVVRRRVLPSRDILNITRCDSCGRSVKYCVDRLGNVKG